MKPRISRLALTALTVLLTAAGLLAGCDGSAETSSREVGLIVEGFYRHPNAGNFMVPRTSGNPVDNMNLRQSGDLLEAYDNNGILFRGTIGRVTGGSIASYTLEGRSTAGEPVTIAGSINVDGATATMTGTWLEPTIASEVFATATVPTNAPAPSATNTAVTLNQTLVSIAAENGTTTFTASGGAGDFSWAVGSGGLGSITSITGSRNNTANYQATGQGNNTVTVSDARGESATAAIRQTISGGGNGDGVPVTLNQTLVTLNALGGTTTFTAGGGLGDFTWSVGNSELGRFTSITGSRNATASYEALAAGNNTVIATDAQGNSSPAATIIQEVIINGGVFPPLPN